MLTSEIAKSMNILAPKSLFSQGSLSAWKVFFSNALARPPRHMKQRFLFQGIPTPVLVDLTPQLGRILVDSLPRSYKSNSLTSPSECP